jgi:uncharacterized protein
MTPIMQKSSKQVIATGSSHMPQAGLPRAIPTVELPQAYGKTKLVLLVRDPLWIYAYWEITSAKIEEVKKYIGVEAYARATKVLRIYDVTDVNFDGHNANSFFDVHLSPESVSWYVNVPESNRSWVAEVGLLTEHGRFIALVRSNGVTTPRVGISNVIDEKWMIPDSEYYKLYELSGGNSIGMSSGDIMQVLARGMKLEEEMSSGSVTSFSKKPEAPQESFWLVVNCELIVYGATEPSAKVTVQGQKIELRPDGTFSMRFALPDGDVDIPVVAKSANGKHTRKANPWVRKETR